MPINNPALVDGYYATPMVKTRNKNALISFGGYWGSYPIPVPPAGPPADEVIRAIILAGRIPYSVDNYVIQTMAYFLQDPQTAADIYPLLATYNPEATENTISTNVRSVLDAFAPRWAKVEVTDQQVEAWKAANGWPPPPPEVPLGMGQAAQPGPPRPM